MYSPLSCYVFFKTAIIAKSFRYDSVVFLCVPVWLFTVTVCPREFNNNLNHFKLSEANFLIILTYIDNFSVTNGEREGKITFSVLFLQDIMSCS